ncbi:MAG: hypothetical protein ACE361_10075 [Aureliella sp.]
MGNPFTQSWIQALTGAASSPYARRVKPSIDLVNRLVRNPDVDDRKPAARELWDYASENLLLETLQLLPARQTRWEFKPDDDFVFQQEAKPARTEFEQWQAALGIGEQAFQLTADANAVEWATMIREQAVRKQQAFSQPAMTTATTLHLPCTALWSGSKWEVRFDSPDWFTLEYEDSVTVDRLPGDEIVDHGEMVFGEAAARLCRDASRCKPTDDLQWRQRVDSLTDLHDRIEQSDLSSRAKQVWNAVWPVVYREESVLAGKADLDVVRGEMASAIKAAPEFTLWTFVFAKLVYQLSAGYGLGFCADFGLD